MSSKKTILPDTFTQADLDNVFYVISETDKFVRALDHALLSESVPSPFPIDGYLDHPLNPYHQFPNQVANIDRNEITLNPDADKFSDVLEIIGMYLERLPISPKITQKFRAFAHQFHQHVQGYEAPVFKKPPQPKEDPPMIWAVKGQLAVAIEAYVRCGMKNPTEAARHIAHCMPLKMQEIISSKSSKKQKSQAKIAFERALLSWHRTLKNGEINKPNYSWQLDSSSREYAQFIFNQRHNHLDANYNLTLTCYAEHLFYTGCKHPFANSPYFLGSISVKNAIFLLKSEHFLDEKATEKMWEIYKKQEKAKLTQRQ